MNELGRLELVRESLVAVVNEMRANVIHSSYSSIIYEGHDFSCALITADGRLVAQGLDDTPVHIFPVPYSAKEVIRAFENDIHEGDIFLHNDPYTGGTHLNDLLMLYPVFHAEKLALFAATRCHWGDVGGMTPGSLSGRVREIYQEGIRIVPTRICERGRMNEAFLDLLFANMRFVHERKGDFNTMLGTSRKAADHLKRLFARFGGTGLLDGIEELIARSERLMRERIALVPDGMYYAEGYLDNDGHSPGPLIGRLKLTIAGDSMCADFSGSSPQCRGPTNVGPAMALNAVATIVKTYLDPHTPVNHGSFNPIQIINPLGSFLNATLPAPCGGMSECRALMASLMVSALGQALPDKLVGDIRGTANHMYLSGPYPDREGMFLLYEYPSGGTGATASGDGGHALRAYSDGDFNAVQAVEIIEAQCAIEVKRYGIRDGSCGDGQFRGGCGMYRELKVLTDETQLSVLSDKNIIPPFGVAGGASGAANRFVVVREGEVIYPSPLPGKIGGFTLRRGDVVRIETAGGGGYGDPLKRDVELVQHDMTLGYITRGQALSRYGVVTDSDGALDSEATELARARLGSERFSMVLRAVKTDEIEDMRRRIRLPVACLGKLGISEGDLIELLVPGGGSPLRGWATVGSTTDIPMGPQGLAVLGARPGNSVLVRVVRIEPDMGEQLVPSPPKLKRYLYR